MSLLRNISAGLRSLLHKKKAEGELDEELREFMEMAVQERMNQGMDRAEAVRAVRFERGSLELNKEVIHSASWESVLETSWRDLCYGLRMLLKNPGFTTIAVLTLAFGIGANTAIFSLTDQILLQYLPVTKPDQLVILSAPGDKPGHVSSDSGDDKVFSYPEYKDIRDRSQVFSGLIARVGIPLAVSEQTGSHATKGELVTGNYFKVLGVRGALGRLFTEQDDTAPGANPVAVLSFGYWTAHFGDDPSVLNKTLTVNGTALTIIGVSQPGFNGVQIGRDTDIFVPVSMKALMTPGWDGLAARNDSWLSLIGRLKPGFTAASAQVALAPTFHAIEESSLAELKLTPGSHRATEYLNRTLELRDGRHGRPIVQSDLQSPLLVLLTLVGLILLIACANLASLLIARGEARQREIAVRLALGGQRWRIVKQLLTESLILALAGGIAGTFLAVLVLKTLIHLVAAQLGISSLNSQVDLGILAFALGISIATAILFGLGPALRVTRGNLPLTLKTQGMAVSAGTSNVQLRKWLMAAQVALTTALLASAGFFLKSLANLEHQNLGVKTDRVAQFSLRPSLNGYNVVQTSALFDRIRDTIAVLPGVRSVSLAEYPLFANDDWGSSLAIEGYNAGPDEEVTVFRDSVGPNYFATLGIPLLAGREFSDSDSAATQKVVVVNEAMADKYFAGRSPLGFHIAWGLAKTHPDIEIVGVVQNNKYEDLRDTIHPFVYQPYTQDTKLNQATFYVQTSGDPSSATQTLREAVEGLAPNLPVLSARTLKEQAEMSIFPDRALTVFAISLGSLAALLAAIGIYGVLAYLVARRTKEIGIRIAIGASRGDVVWLIFKEVIAMVGTGLVIGLIAALVLGWVVQTQLYGVKAGDPLVFLGAALLLATVVSIAAWLPARKATTLDPINALRCE